MLRDQSLNCRRLHKSRPRLSIYQSSSRDLVATPRPGLDLRRDNGSHIPHAATVGLVTAGGPANVPLRAASPPGESRADPGPKLQA